MTNELRDICLIKIDHDNSGLAVTARKNCSQLLLGFQKSKTSLANQLLTGHVSAKAYDCVLADFHDPVQFSIRLIDHENAPGQV